ncbi:MAG: hypothetical protein KAS66_11365, partial [Candidatus Omnitrophica bacterium]|nr:hypothetical protein [Candidatus Omnitrophota bacterium]
AAYVERSVSSPVEETKAHTLSLTPHQPNKFKKRDVPVFAQMAASPVKECDSFPSPLREFAVGLKKWADYENSRYFKHPFWRDEIFLGRFYQNIRPDSEYLTLFGNKIHHSDMSEVNRILVPQGYVYLSGKHRGGKKTFFLAGIHKRIHKGDFEIFITNEELISSLSLTDLAVLIFSEKIIIGRKRIAESMFWACVAAVKRGGFEQIRPLAKYGLELLTGCEEKRLIAGRPEEIMENIKQTAELWLTHSYINHEWGHIEARRLSISGRLFECLGLAIDLKDQESECVFTALDEVMADTIKKGKYSALIAQEEPSRFGLLCIDLINIIVPTTNPIFDLQQKFAKELLPAFIKYAKTGEIVYFEEAVRRVADRCHGYFKLIDKHGYDAGELIRNAINNKYRDNIHKLNEDVSDLKLLPGFDFVRSVRRQRFGSASSPVNNESPIPLNRSKEEKQGDIFSTAVTAIGRSINTLMSHLTLALTLAWSLSKFIFSGKKRIPIIHRDITGLKRSEIIKVYREGEQKDYFFNWMYNLRKKWSIEIAAQTALRGLPFLSSNR